jgi:hypothetical protein
MFVLITCDHTGEELDRFELGDDEKIRTPRFYADMHAARTDELRVAPEDGIVPLGCADFTVTIKDETHGEGCCWTCESFFWDAAP